MKITQGRTLEQFVEYLYSEYTPMNNDNIVLRKAKYFDLAVNYMQMSSTELKPGDFVNPYEKPKMPIEGTHDEPFAGRLSRWQDAESKIIFKNAYKRNVGLGFFDVIINKHKIGVISKAGEFISHYKTRSDLFRATNGELKMKNLEI